jgi:hypothetical protein
VLGWVETHAHTRMRHRGHVMCVDAEGIVVGVFRQHTSRRLDPQLHTHAVIANRVPAPDGRWLALDARTIKIDQRTLSALYHANLRSELTRRLGVAGTTGARDRRDRRHRRRVLAEFSQRTTMSSGASTRSSIGSGPIWEGPDANERWRLEREAVVDSRPAKPHGPTRPTCARVAGTDGGVGHDPDLVVRDGRSADSVGSTSSTTVCRDAGDNRPRSLGERQSTWRPAELVRELAAAVPTTMAVDSAELTDFLDRLADDVAADRCVDISRPVPAGARLRRDGRPLTESAVDRALTTRAILDEEEKLIAWAERRKDEAVDRRRVRPIRFADHLTPGQAAAAAAGRRWRRPGADRRPRRCRQDHHARRRRIAHLAARGRLAFGVAPTAAAAEVLATETAMPADTLDKLLTEHSHPTGHPNPPTTCPPGPR